MNLKLARRATLILMTAGGEEQAAAIARALVGEQLAACVNFWPVRSLYRWRGEIHDDREYLALIKTRAALAARVERRIKELHDYEVPEVLALAPVGGSESYLQWLFESTAPPPRRNQKARASARRAANR